MQKCQVPGVSLAVIKEFDIHWTKGFGTADVETGLPVVATTLFQAASISKPVTAMIVLRAVQDGLIAARLWNGCHDKRREWRTSA